MITLAPSVATPSNDHLNTLAGLIRLLASPDETTRLIEDLQTAAKTAADAVKEAQELQAQALADREKADAEIAAARAANEKKLSSQRFEAEAEIAKRERAVGARERAVEQNEALVKRHLDEVEKLKADLQRKVDAVRALAAGN